VDVRLGLAYSQLRQSIFRLHPNAPDDDFSALYGAESVSVYCGLVTATVELVGSRIEIAFGHTCATCNRGDEYEKNEAALWADYYRHYIEPEEVRERHQKTVVAGR
jgi:hypothetical protein